jgi:2-amino-4-hydroxy-6-hydroxymethyldihydropteridine diphosphokinase
MTRSMSIEARSSVFETEPWGMRAQRPFLNAVVSGYTQLQPRAFLQDLLAIEREMGRERTVRYGPRLIDLDLLVYGDLLIAEPGLVVPHPRIAERSFVLVPLAQIAPDLTVPGLELTVNELAARVDKEGVVLTSNSCSW